MRLLNNEEMKTFLMSHESKKYLRKDLVMSAIWAITLLYEVACKMRIFNFTCYEMMGASVGVNRHLISGITYGHMFVGSVNAPGAHRCPYMSAGAHICP